MHQRTKMWPSATNLTRILLMGVMFVGAMPMAFGQPPNLDELDIVLKSIHNGPIAQVNGVDIPKSEFVELYNARIAAETRAGGSVPEVDRVRLGIYCLGQVIQREILWQEAQRRKLKVDEAQVKTVLDRTLEGLSQANPDRKMSQDDVLALAGTSRDEALSEVRKGLLIEKAREVISKENGVSVSDSAVMEYYNEHANRFQRPASIHLKQIYYRVPRVVGDAATVKREESRKKAEASLAKLKQGITFEGLARNESEGPAELRENGGDMGPLPVSELPPVIVEAARHLKPGEVSGVVESQFGFHIIKLVEVLDPEPVDMERAKKMIRAELLKGKSEAAVRAFVQNVMKDGTYDVTDYLNIERQLELRPDLIEQLTAESPSGS